MNKKTTLPISATVAYDKKHDTVVLTSSDKKLEGSRFRVVLRKDTLEDLKLRQLLAATPDPDQTGLPTEPTFPTEPTPVSLRHLDGLIPLGTTYGNEPILWNVDKKPHALIVGNDPRERTAFTEMLLSVIRSQTDWLYCPLRTHNNYPLTLETLETDYLEPRYELMRKEGVAWYTEASEDWEKVMVVVEAAETLHPDHERLLNRILILGPAAGIQVVAIASSTPDWQHKMLANFNVKILLGEHEAGKWNAESDNLFGQLRQGVVTVKGAHSAIIKTKDTYLPVRFHNLPE